jgi:hypothetical protein
MQVKALALRDSMRVKAMTAMKGEKLDAFKSI